MAGHDGGRAEGRGPQEGIITCFSFVHVRVSNLAILSESPIRYENRRLGQLKEIYSHASVARFQILFLLMKGNNLRCPSRLFCYGRIPDNRRVGGHDDFPIACETRSMLSFPNLLGHRRLSCLSRCKFHRRESIRGATRLAMYVLQHMRR